MNLIERIAAWIQRHIGWRVVFVLVLPVIAIILPKAAAVIGGGGHEVTHALVPTYSMCSGKPIKGITSDNCRTWYEYKLANTGSDVLEKVTITLAPSASLTGSRTFDLVASTTPTARVHLVRGKTPGIYTVSDLPPNTLIIARLETVGLEDAGFMEEQGAAIDADGRVIDMDPQSAAWMRMLYSLALLLGF